MVAVATTVILFYPRQPVYMFINGLLPFSLLLPAEEASTPLGPGQT